MPKKPAKIKRGRPRLTTPNPDKKTAMLSIKCRPEWLAWVRREAACCNMTTPEFGAQIIAAVYGVAPER